ncbi:MAG TPA: MMPL family transporter, partial [Solirubrobacteraceae bacterium]|nr:MMPL family transporter [Solirubrobacteraceae bacterium]
ALLALASPVLGLRITQVDWNVLPSSTPARSVHDTIRRDFPATNNSPVLLAVHTPPNADVAGPLAVYAARLRALPGVDAVRGPTRLSPRVAQLEVVPSDPPLSSASETLVRRIRALASPFGVLAGGETASLVDLKHSLAARLPLALAIVILVTLIAVFLLTRSVVLAVKALLMSSLTIAAVLGALVLVFQNGALEGLLGYTSSHALEPSTLVLIFAMSFGLATDYGIFLLSRIKELRDRGASDRQAVADGVERTGPVVTAAALLLCVALGSLISADHALVKEVGFGAALAVAIDATIVRGLLLPSLMCLLGKWNWWAPRLLRAPAPAGAYAPAPAGGQPPAPAGAHAAAVPAPAAAAGHAAGASAEILEPAGAAPARNGGGAVARVARRSPSDPSPAGSADALALTPFCDHDHPSIREAMAEIKRRAGAGDEEEWAVAAFEFVRDEVLYTLGEWGVPASRTLAERGGTCTNKANLLVALLRAAGIPAAYGVMRVNAREYFGVLGPPFLTRFCSEESVHIYAGAFLSGRWVKCDASTDSELAGRTAHFCRQTVLVEWDGRRDSLDFLDERHVHADLGLFANIDELLQRPARAATPQLWAMGNAYIDFIRAQPPFESDAALMAAYRDSLAGERPRTSSEIFVVGVD